VNNSDYSMIDQILKTTSIRKIPLEFIAAAKVEYEEGDVKIISGNDLRKILRNDLTLEELGISEIRLWINVSYVRQQSEKIVKHIVEEMTSSD
jgi:hypothetical protein